MSQPPTPPATFLVRLRPAPGPDGIRALRAALKALWRRHGIRCISAVQEPAANARKAADHEQPRCFT